MIGASVRPRRARRESRRDTRPERLPPLAPCRSTRGGAPRSGGLVWPRAHLVGRAQELAAPTGGQQRLEAFPPVGQPRQRVEVEAVRQAERAQGGPQDWREAPDRLAAGLVAVEEAEDRLGRGEEAEPVEAVVGAAGAAGRQAPGQGGQVVERPLDQEDLAPAGDVLVAEDRADTPQVPVLRRPPAGGGCPPPGRPRAGARRTRPAAPRAAPGSPAGRPAPRARHRAGSGRGRGRRAARNCGARVKRPRPQAIARCRSSPSAS